MNINECRNYKPISKYIFKLPYEYTQCTNCYDDEMEKSEREKKIDYCQTKE